MAFQRRIATTELALEEPMATTFAYRDRPEQKQVSGALYHRAGRAS
jgi:hypothetical protein